MELDSMGVDPDYWRRGYGTLLCRDGIKIAEDEKCTIGVFSAISGEPLYRTLGFRKVETIALEDNREGFNARTELTVYVK